MIWNVKWIFGSSKKKQYEEYKYKEYQGKCLKNFWGGGNLGLFHRS